MEVTPNAEETAEEKSEAAKEACVSTSEKARFHSSRPSFALNAAGAACQYSRHIRADCKLNS